MKHLEIQQIINDPSARVENYKQMVQAYYDQVTDAYRKDWGDSFHFCVFSGSETLLEAMLALEHFIADEGGFKPGMKVLDVGCGVGGPALNIAKYSGAHITGVNIHEGQLEIARQRAAEKGLSKHTKFILADAMDMPFPEGSFDGVYVFEAGCHMPDKAKFYKECARVLRPGGILLGTDWMYQDGLRPEVRAKYIEPICRYHAIPHLITLVELHNYLTCVGLEVEALDNLGDRGNILRNWELLENKIVKTLHNQLPWILPPVLRMLMDGGYALLEGAKAGAFIIGHWRAHKLST